MTHREFCSTISFAEESHIISTTRNPVAEEPILVKDSKLDIRAKEVSSYTFFPQDYMMSPLSAQPQGMKSFILSYRPKPEHIVKKLTTLKEVSRESSPHIIKYLSHLKRICPPKVWRSGRLHYTVCWTLEAKKVLQMCHDSALDWHLGATMWISSMRPLYFYTGIIWDI